MNIRERLKQRVEAGAQEQLIEIDGARVIVRGRSDVRPLREAWLISDDEAEEGAKVLSKKLKSLYKLDGGVTPNEYRECKLISMVAFDEQKKPLDEIFVAALCRVDSIAFMAALAAAMTVTGILDPVSLTSGNLLASANGSDSSGVSSGQPESPAQS